MKSRRKEEGKISVDKDNKQVKDNKAHDERRKTKE